jgi:hypothetical protein
VEPTSAFSATIHWGDGTTSAGTITLSGTTYVVKGSHTFVTSGSHTVSITVTEIGSAPTKQPSGGPATVAGGPAPFTPAAVTDSIFAEVAATPPAGSSAAGGAGSGSAVPGLQPQRGTRDEFLIALSGGSGGSKRDDGGLLE